MYRITELASLCGLSRSTLLYYHRIRLLSPSVRTQANYRLYSEQDRARLDAICTYRRAGLGIEDIRALLAEPDNTTQVLHHRLHGLGDEIKELQDQQRLLAGMLQMKARGWSAASLDKAAWVAMFKAAGMNDEAMDAWHREFEARAPKAHQAFLESLGIGDAEIARIRESSRSGTPGQDPDRRP